jgi:GNAT superfamily N-acetyltransferase
MKTEYTIREAGPGDIEALTGLLKILFAIETDFIFDEIKQLRGLQLMLGAADKHCIMVAEVGGQVIGMCTAQLLVSTAEGGMAALVEDMVVASEYRQQGIGKHLLLSIEDWAVRQGATRLELLADRMNTPALEFYQRMNWRQTRLICLHKKY